MSGDFLDAALGDDNPDKAEIESAARAQGLYCEPEEITRALELTTELSTILFKLFGTAGAGLLKPGSEDAVLVLGANIKTLDTVTQAVARVVYASHADMMAAVQARKAEIVQLGGTYCICSQCCANRAQGRPAGDATH